MTYTITVETTKNGYTLPRHSETYEWRFQPFCKLDITITVDPTLKAPVGFNRALPVGDSYGFDPTLVFGYEPPSKYL